MATFKIKDRVRVVAVDAVSESSKFLGAEGTIKAEWTHARYQWEVHFDKPVIAASGCPHHRGAFDSCHLAPLTDPKESEWADEAVRKVTKPEPVAPALPVKERA